MGIMDKYNTWVIFFVFTGVSVNNCFIMYSHLTVCTELKKHFEFTTVQCVFQRSSTQDFGINQFLNTIQTTSDPFQSLTDPLHTILDSKWFVFKKVCHFGFGIFCDVNIICDDSKHTRKTLLARFSQNRQFCR